VLDVMGAMGRFSEVVERPEVATRLDALASTAYEPLPGPSRADLLAVLEG
jgi:hypothetical protein